MLSIVVMMIRNRHWFFTVPDPGAAAASDRRGRAGADHQETGLYDNRRSASQIEMEQTTGEFK